MIREQLVAPSPTDLTAFLLRHTRTRDCLVQVAGLAEVTYQGRAASTADVGSYLVLLKRDGSLQIHAPKGVKPMNWQPRTDEITARVEDGQCVLLASRRSRVEQVRVVFLEAQLAQALELSEEAGFVLSGSEAQMQDALARHPDLIEPGLRVLNRELLVESGGIDLYAQDAVSQLARYVASVQRMVGSVVVRGILAAPSITTPARAQLEGRGFEFREVQALPAVVSASTQPGLFEA
ncbi:endonuclease NucS (plasmid) [Deinococcus aetherius]|uniref:Endonuclease NucS n=1 Tax=Deinococcus aetherius TaxID=200252 RepID=A0ABM8AKF7_9DEIO|nr:endonuclease NucS [Deinococcus aetherius]